MSRPRLLDLFCGGGGAGMGYHRGGFEVVGIDVERQPSYPFEFRQADALDVLAAMADNADGWRRDEFAAIHASPPCQGYSRLRHLPWLRDREYPLLIKPVRGLLRRIGLPYVIENVEDAPLDPSIVLCGGMFGLPMYRHRRFELSHWMLAPGHPRHRHVIQPGRRTLGRRYHGQAGVVGVHGQAGVPITIARQAMDIDWMTRAELTQAIPPAYTQWIGEQLLHVLETAA